MNQKRRFSADDWASLGLDALARQGAEAVKLEAICDAAGLTRGSFYYHFKDHGAFLVALARRWAMLQTEDVARDLVTVGTADQTAAALTHAAMGIDFRLELGMRELARRVPKVAEIVRDTDKVRLQILAEIYAQRFDLDPDMAARMAHLEYATFCGVILITPDIPQDQQEACAALYDDLIVRALGVKT